MSKTLIIAGIHEPEADFGRKVIKYFKTRFHFDNIFYHQVSNNKGSVGGFLGRHNRKPNETAYAEVVEQIKEITPSLLIDIHSCISYNKRYLAQIAAKDHTKLDHLTNITWDESMIYGGKNGGILVFEWGNEELFLPNMIKTHKSMNYVGIEMFLDERSNNPEYKPEIEFTANLIKKVLDCEK